MAFLEYHPTQTLFQYCSPEAFFGILQSKHLWFSDLASANDPREIRLGHTHFIEALKSVCDKEFRGERGQFLSVLAERLAEYRTTGQAFSCCFSLVGDELPMWGAYGANYSGLAIGFRPTALIELPCRIQKVTYLDENTPEDFKRLVLEIAGQFDATRNPDDLIYWVDAVAYAFAAMTALKHSTWSYEKEVRLVHARRIQPPDENEDKIFSITDYFPDGKPVWWSQPLERTNGTRAVKYLEFPFGRFRNGAFDPSRAIERIVIGPNCPLSLSDVTDAMRQLGYERFEVAKSICEIR